jgi:hypothetical protein
MGIWVGTAQFLAMKIPMSFGHGVIGKQRECKNKLPTMRMISSSMPEQN